MREVLKLKKSQIIFPKPGEHDCVKDEIIEFVREYPDIMYLLCEDGTLEVYMGTNATAQGYKVVRFDPAGTKRRPGVGQWAIDYSSAF